MATNFPTSVDSLVNPVSNDSLNSPSHSAQHANANDAIEAVESYVLTTQPTFRNAVINGGFDIWQRGISSLPLGNAGVAASTTADRWASFRPANPTAVTVSRISGTGVVGAPYAARIQRTAANTSVDKVTFGQTIEIADASKFAGETVTLSFYARAGANYSASGSTLTNVFKSGTGTSDLNGIYNSYTGEISTSESNTLTTSFQRFTRSITLGANVTQIAFSFEFTPTGTAGAGDYVDITGVQLEDNIVATAFERRPIGVELALCQRFYFRSTANTTSDFGWVGIGTNVNTVVMPCVLPVNMRVSPTSVDFSNLRVYDVFNAAIAVSAVALNASNSNISTVTLTASSINLYRPYVLLSTTLPSFIGFSAEL
jgi:hypothetical protein